MKERRKRREGAGRLEEESKRYGIVGKRRKREGKERVREKKWQRKKSV